MIIGGGQQNTHYTVWRGRWLYNSFRQEPSESSNNDQFRLVSVEGAA